MCIEESDGTGLPGNILLEIVKVVTHAQRMTPILEPRKARASLVVGEEDDSTVVGRRTTLILEVLVLFAKHLVLVEISGLTCFRAVRHVVAVRALEGCRPGAYSAKRRISRGTARDGLVEGGSWRSGRMSGLTLGKWEQW